MIKASEISERAQKWYEENCENNNFPKGSLLQTEDVMITENAGTNVGSFDSTQMDTDRSARKSMLEFIKYSGDNGLESNRSDEESQDMITTTFMKNSNSNYYDKPEFEISGEVDDTSFLCNYDLLSSNSSNVCVVQAYPNDSGIGISSESGSPDIFKNNSGPPLREILCDDKFKISKQNSNDNIVVMVKGFSNTKIGKSCISKFNKMIIDSNLKSKSFYDSGKFVAYHSMYGNLGFENNKIELKVDSESLDGDLILSSKRILDSDFIMENVKDKYYGNLDLNYGPVGALFEIVKYVNSSRRLPIDNNNRIITYSLYDFSNSDSSLINKLRFMPTSVIKGKNNFQDSTEPLKWTESERVSEQQFWKYIGPNKVYRRIVNSEILLQPNSSKFSYSIEPIGSGITSKLIINCENVNMQGSRSLYSDSYQVYLGDNLVGDAVISELSDTSFKIEYTDLSKIFESKDSISIISNSDTDAIINKIKLLEDGNAAISIMITDFKYDLNVKDGVDGLIFNINSLGIDEILVGSKLIKIILGIGTDSYYGNENIPLEYETFQIKGSINPSTGEQLDYLVIDRIKDFDIKIQFDFF